MKLKMLIFTVMLLLGTSSLHATLYTFQNITNGDPIGDNTVSWYSVDVSAGGTGQAVFTFYNNCPSTNTSTDIDAVYFDDGTLLGVSSLTQSSGVSFTQDSDANPVSPANLPQGENLTPPFEATKYFSADADPGAIKGINTGEWLEITFNLLAGKTIEDVYAALAADASGLADSLRIGIHVQNVDISGNSDTFVNDGPAAPVPEPATMILLGTGLLGIGGFRLRKKNRKIQE